MPSPARRSCLKRATQMWVYVVAVALLGVFLWYVNSNTPLPKKKAAAEVAPPVEEKKKPAKVDVTRKKAGGDSKSAATHEKDEKSGGAAAAGNDLLKDTLKGHAKEVTSVCYAPNGLWMASASKDRTLRIWNCADKTNVSRVNLKDDHIRTLIVTGDSKYIACLLDYTRKVQFYGVAVTHKEDESAAAAPAATGPGAVRRAAKLLHEFSIGDEHIVTPRGFGVAPNAAFVLTAGEGDTGVNIYSAKGVLLNTINTRQIANHCTAVSTDSKYFAIGTQMANLKLYGVSYAKSGGANSTEIDLIENVNNLVGHTKAVTAVGFGANQTVVTGSSDGTLRVYGLAGVRFDLKEDPTLKQPVIETELKAVDRITVASNGLVVLVSGETVHFYLIAAGTSQHLRAIEFAGGVLSLSVSGDGNSLALCGGDSHAIRVYDLKKLIAATAADAKSD